MLQLASLSKRGSKQLGIVLLQFDCRVNEKCNHHFITSFFSQHRVCSTFFSFSYSDDYYTGADNFQGDNQELQKDLGIRVFQ